MKAAALSLGAESNFSFRRKSVSAIRSIDQTSTAIRGICRSTSMILSNPSDPDESYEGCIRRSDCHYELTASVHLVEHREGKEAAPLKIFSLNYDIESGMDID